MPRKPNPETILKKELKSAIDAGDWDKVARITSILKGEPPVPPPPKKEQIVEPSPLSKFIAGHSSERRKIPPPLDNEPFVDDPSFCAEDREISRLLASNVPVSRTRECGLTEIICSRCRKEVIVSKKLLTGRSADVGSEFICDKCLGQFRR